MSPSPPSVRTARHPIHLTLGFTAWALWFSVVYGATAVACAAARPPLQQGAWTWVNAALLAFTVLTAAGLAAAAWGARGAARRIPEDGGHGGRDRFIATGAAALYLAAAICTLVVGAPLLLLPPCS